MPNYLVQHAEEKNKESEQTIVYCTEISNANESIIHGFSVGTK